MVDPVIKDPANFAKIPAGTRVSWGLNGATLATAKLLQNAMGIGAMGEKGAFLKATRLIDTSHKYIGDMGEGEDKTFVFLDDPDDKNQEDLLASAKAKEAVIFFIEYPNGRIAEVGIVLSSWSMQQVDAPDGKILQTEVYGKQNSILWTAKN